AGAEANYARAFRDHGLDVGPASREEVRARIRQSPIRAQLVAALDAWAVLRAGQPGQVHLLTLAREADPDDDAWRLRLRQVLERGEAQALWRMAAEAEKQPLSPGTALLLAGALANHESRWETTPAENSPAELAVRLLRRVQQQYADDFSLNHALGRYLRN